MKNRGVKIVLVLALVAGFSSTRRANGATGTNDAPKPGELSCRPTFVSCGVRYGLKSGETAPKLEVRDVSSGGDWSVVEEFPAFPAFGECRGSVLGLKEDTEYEIRVGMARRKFRTWQSDVPVARTVTIDPKTARFPIRISERAVTKGWVRYTVPHGIVLENGTEEPTIIVENASGILIDDIVFRGSAGAHTIVVRKSEGVRIRNCEFSDWGHEYEMRYDSEGAPYKVGSPAGTLRRTSSGNAFHRGIGRINFEGAVCLSRGTSGAVIERCWFHDSRVHSNSWYYSHPCGNNAITLDHVDHSTVIRWCDFTGSDLHRWNDAIESNGNFDADGGAHQDADIYGNFMIFANDDCIELDGGQLNVRCFGNRLESALCGVSVQGCVQGPSYVWRNGFYSMCDEFGDSGQTVKTGGGPHGTNSYVSVCSNLLWGAGHGLSWREGLRCRMKGNRFCGEQKLTGQHRSPDSKSEGDVFGLELAEADLPVGVPIRPLGFRLDRARFSGIRLRGGTVTPSVLKVKARSTSDADIPFVIAKNRDFPWLVVAPARGVIPAGGEVELSVTFNTSLMTDRHDYRGCFLVRTPEGLSRAVSVYVETDFELPFKAERPGETAVYRKATPGQREFEFTVPKDGRYYFFLHAWTDAKAGSGKRLRTAVDDDKPEISVGHVWNYPVWMPVAPRNDMGCKMRFWDFKAGERHVLRISDGPDPIRFDAAVLTDAPGSFEPR